MRDLPLSPLPRLGVVIVTFNAADVILDCLESLLASGGVALDIIVVDNASNDGTLALLRDWAAGDHVWTVPEDCPFTLHPFVRDGALPLDGGAIANSPHRLRLLDTGVNGGFAAGVNAGLHLLAAQPDIDRFWVLNPDSMVPEGTAQAFATQVHQGFSLMGGRVLYYDTPEIIQFDGGTINARSGVTGNLGLGARHALTPPLSDTRDMDFITGASMVASRAFYEAAGPMPEDYFLYYEEVDWAQRRGPLPLAYCADGIVFHKAGTAIGSPTLQRPASAFSLYFKHRGRLLFMWRYHRRAVPMALLYSFAKAGQLLLKGYAHEAATILVASFGLPAPRSVRSILSPEAQRRAFDR